MAYGPPNKAQADEAALRAWSAAHPNPSAKELQDFKNSLDIGKGDKYRLEMPAEIGYSAAYDPNTMSMGPDLQKKLDAIQLDKTGLNQFRQEATRSGPSAWAGLARGGAAMDAQAAREAATRGAQGGAAEARAGMARRGGIGSGAEERLGTAAMKNSLMAQQGAYRDQGRANLDISMADEKGRVAQLGALPGMEVQALQPEIQKTGMWQSGKQFDLGNTINEGRDKNTFNLGQYGERMKAWAAGQTAAAQREAGK